MAGGIRGLEAEGGVLRRTVEDFFRRPGVQVPNCSPENFVQAILTAVEKAWKRN
jgi:hypothetical protein